ncbi:MAG: MOSC domain-containing protein, partial [Chthoniobacterales bacterium]
MSTIGTVESVWRYPVKSMRGEELLEIFTGFAGVYGDRICAFHSPARRKGLPYLTAREQRRMLTFRPRFRDPEKAAAPPNLTDAEKLGATPVYADRMELDLDIETPDGRILAIDDPALLEMLRDGIDAPPHRTLLRSDRALTDARPVSLIGLASIKQLADETGIAVDKRRFRANLYLDLTSGEGFAEDRLVGRSLRVGPKATLAIVDRDSRCMIITLDPETGERAPALLKTVAQKHEGRAGVYAVVLV